MTTAFVAAILAVGFASAPSPLAPVQQHAPEVLTPRFSPPMPEHAPANIRAAVVAGRALMNDLRAASHASGARSLNCQGCHFEAGRTQGGLNGGISLVGSAVDLPTREGNGQLENLSDRINRCVRTNLNLPPLEPTDLRMKQLQFHLHWLAAGIPTYAAVPWLGTGVLPPPHKSKPTEAGGAVHQQFCAVCHGRQGQGSPIAPAQWGPGSFSRQSQFAEPQRLASFVHRNMPRSNPILSVEQAWATAVYLLSQPRPDGFARETR